MKLPKLRIKSIHELKDKAMQEDQEIENMREK